jgi:nucleoid-associated protein YgaU
MRAFFFGLLVAGFVFWWSGLLGGGDPAAGAGGGEVPHATGAKLDQTLGEAAPTAAPQRVPLQPLMATTGGSAPAADTAAIAELLPRLAQREPAAVALGWATLANQAGGADRGRLAAALEPAGGDFASLHAALGPDNSFLHSAEGRGLAAKAATAAFALGDADACSAGTQLLGSMLKGRILREDRAQRALVDDVYRQHRIRVDRWLCDPANVAGARTYTVVGGDSLARIAGRFRKEKVLVEDGTLAILNRVHNPNALQVGQKLKVPVAPIRGVLEKRSFGLAIFVGDHLLRLYWVGHGENDRTPVTEFTVGAKQPKPQWTAPNGEVYPYGHPENILGEYFVKLLHDSYTGFGIHGTPQPDTICTMSSAGCIRMFAPDIDELFRLLPAGAKVEIRATESLR